MARGDPKFTLKGEEKMRRRMETLARKIPDRTAAALRVEAEMIMTRSKREFVPADAGALKSSGFVNDVKRRGKNLTVTLGFGGAAAAYATAVHEHPSKSSPPSWKGKAIEDINWNIEGTGPKYLEKPLKEAVKGMAERIAKVVLPRDIGGRFTEVQ